MSDQRHRARVTTKAGDGGDTSLFGPGRIRKTDPRVEALGDLDETQAAIGVARAIATGTVEETLLELQRGLYVVMSEVGTPTSQRSRLQQRVDATAVAALDERGAALRATVDIAGAFVIPGEDELSARLDLARAVARRAERRVVALADAGLVEGEHLLAWLNRLSDTLFVLSRAVEPSARSARLTPARQPER
ncbi:MAG TPA: cob(I)yrinic acid a,c-diamide adenosyltransferase [Candidatus Limnocylindria bacterium]|nr:cob(I)yrinic acid a,c-diamide adenosyltransferase [Candidatus Limnocylindria bacterium]